MADAMRQFSTRHSIRFLAQRFSPLQISANGIRWLAIEKSQLPLLLPISFAFGIGLWFALPLAAQWLVFIAGTISVACCLLALQIWHHNISGMFRWVSAILLMMAAGMIVIWGKSLWIAPTTLEKPWIGTIQGEIIEVEPRPAEGRIRYRIALNQPSGVPEIVRLSQKTGDSLELQPASQPGAAIKAQVRLMPPNGPVLPGAYDFARRAWFEGLGATGSILGTPEFSTEENSGSFASLRLQLSSHVQSQLAGSEGGIAATLATGDRGGISPEDSEAMRQSGLAHLLALSGLHVSAVIGAVFLLTLKLLALSPSLALRLKLPLLAASLGAMAGVAYTIFTGAEIPTIRACVAALLILLALAMGRDPLSLRLVAFAAFIVLLIWPEALIGPSFQMSFAAVIVIVALYDTPYMRKLSLMRDEGDFSLPRKALRFLFMLFITGLAIEVTLMPIALYHFNKAGMYGAFANLAAIPLTTFVIMPLEAMALLGDLVGLGEPFWWLCSKALSLLLAIARNTAAFPGAVLALPAFGTVWFVLLVLAGLLFLCLRSPLRFLGAVPGLIAVIVASAGNQPDILIAANGKQLAIRSNDGDYILLDPESDSFANAMIREQAGLAGKQEQGSIKHAADCSEDFCSLVTSRESKSWTVLIGISQNYVPLRSLSSACSRSDIVIAPRTLPRSCRPRWLKADGRYLRQSGGILVYLSENRITPTNTFSDHGWKRRKQYEAGFR